MTVPSESSLPASDRLRVPDGAVPYILLQRSRYLALRRNRWIGPLLRMHQRLSSRTVEALVYRFEIVLESAVRRSAIKSLYGEGMRQEYLELRPWLPARGAAILDIGCGLAGVDVFLHRHYGAGDAPTLYLLDKTKMDGLVYFDFHERGAFYNSLELARRLLEENGIPGQDIHTLTATSTNDIVLPAPVGFDLVLSLRSWGFHYPVATYLDRVHGLLQTGGVLILDVRKETDGLDRLQQTFGQVRIISEESKNVRVLAVK